MSISDAAVLVVADDRALQEQTVTALTAHGLGPVTCLSERSQIASHLEEHPCRLVLVDIGQPHNAGVQLIADITAVHPQVAIVALSSANDATAAVSCIHRGAYDYLVKPLDPQLVVEVVRRALSLHRARPAPTSGFKSAGLAHSGILGADPAMAGILAYVAKIAASGQSVLITGETGTGKDLIARALHDQSGRRGEYVPVSTAGMDDTQVADMLFGHRRGAFAETQDMRAGLILRASSGTLFLDEIGDLSAVSQVKLLRLLQDGEYYPLGSDQPKRSTARIVASTSSNLTRLQAVGRFRKDLFYRLRAHHIEVPPLRDRRGDIPLLFRHFLARAAADLGRPQPDLADDVMEALLRHPFPGNVRELQSLAYDALARIDDGTPICGQVLAQALDEVPRALGDFTPDSIVFPQVLPSLSEVQHLLVAEALRRTGGNQTAAAQQLGVTRQAINKRLQ